MPEQSPKFSARAPLGVSAPEACARAGGGAAMQVYSRCAPRLGAPARMLHAQGFASVPQPQRGGAREGAPRYRHMSTR